MCWCQFLNKFDSRVDHLVRNRMPFLLTSQIYLPYIYLVIYIHIGEKLKLVVKEILTSDWPGIGKLLLTLLQSEEILSHVFVSQETKIRRDVRTKKVHGIYFNPKWTLTIWRDLEQRLILRDFCLYHTPISSTLLF